MCVFRKEVWSIPTTIQWAIWNCFRTTEALWYRWISDRREEILAQISLSSSWQEVDSDKEDKALLRGIFIPNFWIKYNEGIFMLKIDLLDSLDAKYLWFGNYKKFYFFIYVFKPNYFIFYACFSFHAR